MSNSKRKTILEYLRDTTIPLITTGNGYNSTVATIKRGIEQVDSLPDSSFPAVFITATRSLRQNISRISVQAKMQVIIEAYVKKSGDTNDLQADLDNIIEDVTEALEQDRTLGGNAHHLEVQEVTTDDGDLAPFGASAFLVEIMYSGDGTTI